LASGVDVAICPLHICDRRLSPKRLSYLLGRDAFSPAMEGQE
jgi:hypothetical protein